MEKHTTQAQVKIMVKSDSDLYNALEQMVRISGSRISSVFRKLLHRIVPAESVSPEKDWVSLKEVVL